MNVIQELQVIHQQIQTLDIKVEQLIQSLMIQGESLNKDLQTAITEEYETIYPLAIDTGFFKGKKPTGVIFEETERINVGTWKKVFQTILCRCDADPEKHVALMNLRGKVSGRERVLLSKESENMRSPLKIAENLYVETHYDTETLLRILLTRILSAVNYDVSHISVAIRNS